MDTVPPRLKKCPYCEKEIQWAAIKCKHCRRFLDNRRRPFFWLWSGALALIVVGTIFLASDFISEPSKPSDEHPYSLMLNRFRQRGEARQYAKRIKEMSGERPYILSRKTASSGIWHEVHVGAVKDSGEIEEIQNRLVRLEIPAQSVKDLRKYASTVITESDLAKVESQEAYQEPVQDLPAIGKGVVDLIAAFPEAPDATVDELYLVDFPDNLAPQRQKICATVMDQRLPDSRLPLGIRKEALNRETSRFGIALYRDLINYRRTWVVTGFLKNPNSDPDFLSSFDAAVKKKVGRGESVNWKIDGVNFSGTIFAAKNPKGEDRLVWLKEAGGEGRFYLASFENGNGKRLKDFFDTTDFSRGLWTHREVKEHIYALPKLNAPDETFFFFNLGRLSDSYARQKGNAEWAERMVGHWNATGNYTHPDGVAFYSYFDLAYVNQAHQIYDRLYLGAGGQREDYLASLMSVDVKGHKGRFVPKWGEQDESEVNFRVGKHIVAVAFQDTGEPKGKEELVARAERLQL